MDTTSTTARLAETPLPELVAELGQLTASVNAIKARQVELVAAITHTHTIEAEDGTLLHLPMSDTYARLDAAALVAGSLGVSQQAAQHWVDRAEKLTGPLAPVHAAMADGVLDEARAKIICDELDEVDDEVAAVVAEHLMPAVRAGLVEDPSGENGVRLKRRVQSALAQVDPTPSKTEPRRTDPIGACDAGPAKPASKNGSPPSPRPNPSEPGQPSTPSRVSSSTTDAPRPSTKPEPTP